MKKSFFSINIIKNEILNIKKYGINNNQHCLYLLKS